ncbi:MAG: hypothetical protein ABSB59_29635 [Streptosporangiaceae bacterium]|jgi:hypothetical protein
MATVPIRRARTSPSRSAIRPPSSVPATPPTRKLASAAPATPRLAPQRAVWLPAAVAHAHQAYGATQLRTVAFPVHVNPLGLTQPTVLSVSRLLRELIIAITDDPARPPDEQHDLKQVAPRPG